MKIELLSKNQHWAPTIAKWYFEEWGYQVDNKTYQDELEKVNSCLNETKLPLLFVAHDEKTIMGVAQLRLHEMKIFPELKHWLGGVYVSKDKRGKGIAAAIISETIKKAKALNIPKLYLQTEKLDGGLYATLGWTAIEKVHDKGVDVLIMEKILCD